MISLTAERIIRDKVTKPLVANGQQTGSKKVTKSSKKNNELIVTLRREIEDLKSQHDKQLAFIRIWIMGCLLPNVLNIDCPWVSQ
jgi:hypothetical protein